MTSAAARKSFDRSSKEEEEEEEDKGGPVPDLRFDVLINRTIEFLGLGGREEGDWCGWDIWKNYRLDAGSIVIMIRFELFIVY